MIVFLLVLGFIGCITEEPTSDEYTEAPLELTLEEANRLAQLPLHCMQTEYPNKMGQVLADSSELLGPKQLHPAFYGCFDWHSSVHGHWMAVRLLKQFPELDHAEEIRSKLLENISAENIAAEVLYFEKKYGKSFERTYGWAWLLKLAEELHTWEDPVSDSLSNNLLPLTNLICNRYLDFLPKLNYPIRVGEHSNTAFGMAFAWDYANAVGHEELQTLIEIRARDFFLSDVECPLTWEPSGFDFLSPCLEEADLMRRVLTSEEFTDWFPKFLPTVAKRSFAWEPGKVSDRTDGKLVHLDGVNFSRAWCMYGIASQYPQYAHLRKVANAHVAYSLPGIVDDNYEGGHWLGSFAVFALAAGQPTTEL